MTLPIISDKVKEYNRINSAHDYTYMFSDCGSTYRAGAKVEDQLAELYKQLDQTEKDLVGLYNNHILKRKMSDGRFGMEVTTLPDTKEYAEIVYVN